MVCFSKAYDAVYSNERKAGAVSSTATCSRDKDGRTRSFPWSTRARRRAIQHVTQGKVQYLLAVGSRPCAA